MVLAAPTLAAIPDATLLAGAPLNIPLSGADADNDILYFSVASSNPQVSVQTLDPFENRTLRVSVQYSGDPSTTADNFSGDMTFQLFENWAPKTTARIIDLATSGGQDGLPFYDGLTFHRVIQDFMVQGGDPKGDGTGGSGTTLDDEMTPELQFTSSGILAMANSGSDTNDSQFFITSAATRWLDGRYTIFGQLTSGDAIRQKIAAVPTGTNNKPTYPVTITSVALEIDTDHPLLHLSAPAGTTGSTDVTVSVWDADPDHQPVTQTFHVTVQPDTTNDPPFIQAYDQSTGAPKAIDPIQTKANTPVNFQIPGVDPEGDAIYYGAMADPSITDVTVSADSSTGVVTVTPATGAVGVRAFAVGVRAPDGTSWDTQKVPLYIRPASPTVSIAADAGTSLSATSAITSLNNTAAKKLRFHLSGLANGASVSLYADGLKIGGGIASGNSMTIETTGQYSLSDGPHTITAQQTLANQAVDVGNFQDTVDLSSDESAGYSLVVDTTAPEITSTPVTAAVEHQAYSYQVTSQEAQAQYRLTTAPSGMSIDASSGLIQWTPGEVGGSSNPVTVRVSDAAGNYVEQTFSVTIQAVNAAPSAVGQQVRVASNGSKAITLSGDDGDHR